MTLLRRSIGRPTDEAEVEEVVVAEAVVRPPRLQFSPALHDRG
jgi:hypothetical protein